MIEGTTTTTTKPMTTIFKEVCTKIQATKVLTVSAGVVEYVLQAFLSSGEVTQHTTACGLLARSVLQVGPVLQYNSTFSEYSPTKV